MKTSVYLIGFMGTGKSSVGKPLAKILKRGYVDSDREIEKREKMTVSRIFEKRGEKAFRKLEREEVARIAKRQNLVVSLGGGALLDKRSREAVSSTGVVALLVCEQQALWRRLRRQSQTRPLLTGGRARMRELLMRRRDSYRAAADMTISTTRITPLQAAKLIARRLP